ELGREDLHFYWIGEFDPDEKDPRGGTWADRLRAVEDTANSNVSFLGLTHDSRPFLRAGDVFVLPSREDPFPLVVLEAAQCGLPIVSFTAPGDVPAFVESDAGCVVPSIDVDAMARQVIALVDDDRRRRALGARARDKVLSTY